MGFLKKRRQVEGDTIVIVTDREIRELPVEEESEEAVASCGLTLPKGDAQVRYFPGGGRAFIYGIKDEDYLCKAENISRLEKSVVLQNLFDYGATEKKSNLQFYIMMAALIITIFLLRG